MRGRAPTSARTAAGGTAVTDLQQFQGRGHSLTIDSGWKEVADATLKWLRANGL